MKGFDGEFRDFPHYIYRITNRIWEGRQVDAIRNYYSADCPVRSPGGLVVGCEAVIDATHATLAEFPDRRLLGEDVIWSGDDERGYLSSHRIFSTAVHSGDGAYGRATGSRLRYRIIADCWCKDNKVSQEWLVRDQGAIARCLGKKPKEMALDQIRAGNAGWFKASDDVPSEYEPVLDQDADASRYMEFWLGLWGEGDLSAIEGLYHHAASLAGPNGKEYVGHAEIGSLHQGYLDSVAKPEPIVHDLTVTENIFGKTVAMRWVVEGSCSGGGRFAAGKKDAPMYIMGINHARFAGGQVEREWALVDDVSLWKQVLA